MTEHRPLDEILDEILSAVESGETSLGELVGRLGRRGFGPLFVMLSAVVVLPTGAIPMVPAAIGLALVLLSLQILVGRSSPWLPRRLREFRIDRASIEVAAHRARPFAARLGRIVRPRATMFIDGPLSLRLAACAILVFGLIMIPVGFIPLLPLLLGVPTLVFGIGLTARDGLAMALGYALALPGFYMLAQQL